MILKIYRGLSYLTYPFIQVLLAKRKKKGKEDKRRFKERLGFATTVRPQGKLIWIHGASVGESLSAMPLVNRLVREKDVTVMVTTGTVTSAELMEKRLPKGAFHQYVPVDYPTYVKRFIRHFHPDVGLFIESDFWPNMLIEAHAQKVPLILLNGRVSDRSFRRWQRAKWFIKPLLHLFALCLGQTQEDARRLGVLGAPNTGCVGNLKFSATPMPIDEDELVAMRNAIGQRPVWVAGSTHDNEEEQAGTVHRLLQTVYPDLLTVIVPRHPNRADDIEKNLLQKGLTVHRRSRGEDVNADVYLGDTIGEMGLFYRLAPIVFVGGSLIPFGGQNMLAPMRAGACTIVGPYAFNFREIVAKAKAQKALIEVKDAVELEQTIKELMQHHTKRQEITVMGQCLANSETAVLDRVYNQLRPWI